MKQIILCCFLFLAACACKPATSQHPGAGSDILCETADSAKIIKALADLQAQKELSLAALTAVAGRQFLDVAYVASTLEHGKDEPLTVEADALDCTTFAETALAIALTVKKGGTTIGHFAGELEKVRYRKAERKGYLSRLHYFSDWIYDNAQKGLISEPARTFGKPVDIEVNFMSAHPESYPVLKENPGLVAEIARQEKEISSRNYFFLPKSEITEKEALLREGDIIGLVTSIKGLDISHVGILVEVEGHIHLMHASTTSNKVVISDEPLTQILQNKKSYTGIMIARPQEE